MALAAHELSQDSPILSLKSPKSRLQEYTQQHSGGRPAYHMVKVTGPDHERVFRIEVSVDDVVLGMGEGPSRRTAETAAASEAMERLRAAERSESVGA